MINRINSIFRRNLPAKILALCVAVILWVVVMNDQNPAIEGSFNVPLAVVNSPEGYKITKSEDSVKIKVRGPRSLFVTATADDFRAYVDLDGAQDGKQDCKVQTALPQGFELVEVAPETVSFDLDKIIQKTRFRKNFRLALHGWMEYHIAAMECSTQSFFSNPAGKEARKTLERNFAPKAN